MTNQTVTQAGEIIKIKIERAGHFYYRSIFRNGRWASQAQRVERELAEEIVLAHSSQPPEGAFDPEPQNWIWVQEAFE